MIEFGRVRRGVVWHLLNQAGGDTWCRAGDPIVEWTQGQPPTGGRPCPRCYDRIREAAAAMAAAADLAGDNWAPRPVETVDLVSALTARQVELQLRDEGPDPQADEEFDAEGGAA